MKKSKFMILSTTLILLFSFVAAPRAVQASPVPTFSVTAVETDVNVTIYTYDFPAGKSFKVLMGEYGTKGVGGIEVATVDSGAGGSFYGTFLIPDALKGQTRIAIRLQGVDTPSYAYNWFYNKVDGTPTPPEGYKGIPTFLILAVTTDADVTIKTNNFPANMDFKVLMGKMWTKGIGGIEVTTINSGAGGVFEATFDIPEALQGEERIAIRLQATSGYYAYNWFWNNTEAVPVPPPGYVGIPTFSILSVETDTNVTIKTLNFPKDMEFDVLMGKMWTQAIDGILVTTINSGEGGVFEATFDIPEALQGEERIAIRLQATSGYYAYNWFWNNTADVPVPPPGYVGIPIFSIMAVAEDDTVTIKAVNFPADMEFDVLMGKMWTQAIGGVYVTTIDTGEGGSFEAAYEIPAGLYGEERIAIRLQSASGYYAYNWFWNNTYP